MWAALFFTCLGADFEMERSVNSKPEERTNDVAPCSCGLPFMCSNVHVIGVYETGNQKVKASFLRLGGATRQPSGKQKLMSHSASFILALCHTLTCAVEPMVTAISSFISEFNLKLLALRTT